MGMRLVMIRCYASAVMVEHMAFDSDSKQIAIDNCSS
jgi:hypothetical protein